ncbi:MAG: hypothetical protein GXY58_19500 [Planctomycetaceae bacterium]|mgnify:CR=1 FL=1|nr:hypothetical protein [Planctomycetaceae bacterium]
MTSGRKLTPGLVSEIQRLVSYRDADGRWVHSYEEIASRLRIDPRTVSHYVREGCRRWHLSSRLRKDFQDLG